MFRKLLILGIGLAAIGGAGWLYWSNSGHDPALKKHQAAQGHTQNKSKSENNTADKAKTDVAFIEIQPLLISRTNELPGRVVSYQVAEIRPQVSGIIQSRLFKEGSYVEEGQQLYQIDPARYEADYQMATANLQDAQARVRNAQNLVNRFKKLIDYNAVSQQEYDDAQASLDQAKAAVSLAEAKVKNAKINLGYTEVYAPISGYISPSSVTRGALVTAQQDLPLATVRQLDPVYVDLSQAAAEAQNLQERLAASRLNDTENKNRYEVTLYLGNSGRTYPHKGILDATDLAVDMQTGAIRLRSVFPNPDNILLPGMFVRASIEDVGRAKEIIIPQKSVSIMPDGTKSVWLIGSGNKAKKQTIRTGAAYKNNWVVLNGLESGDHLIVEGMMMLREGEPVAPEKIEAGYKNLSGNVPPPSLKKRAPPPQDAESTQAVNNGDKATSEKAH